MTQRKPAKGMHGKKQLSSGAWLTKKSMEGKMYGQFSKKRKAEDQRRWSTQDKSIALHEREGSKSCAVA